jgi:hypothetical protein
MGKKQSYIKKSKLASSSLKIEKVQWVSNSSFIYLTGGKLILFDLNNKKETILTRNVNDFKYFIENDALIYTQNKSLFYNKSIEVVKQSPFIEVGEGVTDFTMVDSVNLAVAFRDGSIKLVSLESNEVICNIISVGKSSMILLDNEGYYMSLKNGLEGVAFRINDQIFPPEQFDLKYNRPDIILKRLNYPDTNLIKAYNHAHVKRIKKLGFTEKMLSADFHVPNIRITNKAEIPIFTESDSVKLSLLVSDSIYSMDRINLWINNVSVYGKDGYPLKKNNSNAVETHIPVELTSGD